MTEYTQPLEQKLAPQVLNVLRMIGWANFSAVLLLDVLAICFSRGQVVNRNGVDINGRGIL